MEVPRELIDQFVRVTNAREALANQLLCDTGLDLEAAIHSFFAIQEAGGVPTSSTPDATEHSADDRSNINVNDEDYHTSQDDPYSHRATNSSDAPDVQHPDVIDVDDDEALARAIHESNNVPDDDEDVARPPIPQYADTLLPHQMRRMSQNVDNPFTTPHGTSRDDTLAALFRPPSHLVFPGTLEEAMGAGQRQRRWLLVNLQRSDVFACLILNRDVWSDSTLQELLRARFIFWQRDETTQDGSRYKQFYSYNQPPHVAIIDPRSGERIQMWGGDGQTVTKDDLLRNLTDFADRNSLDSDTPVRPVLPSSRGQASASTAPQYGQQPAQTQNPIHNATSGDTNMDSSSDIAETEDAQLAAAIAASMEDAYENGNNVEPNGRASPRSSYADDLQASVSGAADNLREVSRQLSASNPALNRDRSIRAQQDSEYQESLALDRAKEESQKAEADRQKRVQEQREAKRRRVPTPPPAGAPNTTELLIRLPSGTRLQRRFYSTDKIGSVYDYVDTETDEAPEGEYDLMTPFPKKTLLDRSTSLSDAGLHPKALLVVHTH